VPDIYRFVGDMSGFDEPVSLQMRSLSLLISQIVNKAATTATSTTI